MDCIKNKVIVSCQAEGNSPFNNPKYLSLFAISAELGGAGGIRAEGLTNIYEIKKNVSLPIIGLVKTNFNDGRVCISRNELDIKLMVELGCDVIAIDGTFRMMNELTGPQFISKIKQTFPEVCLLADISTVNEAIACFNVGADAIATTLRGYTQETEILKNTNFDLGFFDQLKLLMPENFPIIAEGKINDVEIVKQLKSKNAWSVVIGTAITRPIQITSNFVNAFEL